MTLIVRSMCVERCHFKALSHTLPQAIITTILGLSQTQTMKLTEVKLSESLPKILPPKQSWFHHVSHCHLMVKCHGPAFTWTSRVWVRSVPGPDFFAFLLWVSPLGGHYFLRVQALGADIASNYRPGTVWRRELRSNPGEPRIREQNLTFHSSCFFLPTSALLPTGQKMKEFRRYFVPFSY